MEWLAAQGTCHPAYFVKQPNLADT